jgi:hypothetical protein
MLHSLFLLLFMLFGCTARQLHPAVGAGAVLVGGGLEHGGEAGIRRAAALVLG